MARARARSIEAALERGRRVYLRKVTRGDRRELIRLRADNEAFFRPWFPSPGAGEAWADDAWFERFFAGSDTESTRAHLVCRRRDEAVMGCCTLGQIVYGAFCSAYLGYWIGEVFAGRGYTSEAVRLVLRRAFRARERGGLGLHRVEANIMPRNKASRRLARGVGFRLEGLSPMYLCIAGVWEDHERYAMTVEGWGSRGASGRVGGV